jgi:hypothetical protein
MSVVRNDSQKSIKKDDKGLPSSSNISIDISHVIHPENILSEPFCYSFHQIFVCPVKYIRGIRHDGCGKV